MMEKQPLVSVIIPTYNHAHFLKEALQSVIDQNYRNWEAIVVNNFSTDNTVEVISSYNDSRIHLENFSNYGVIAASRNRGIKISHGDYIAFLDSDDKWYPEKLETCMKAFEPGIDLVGHGLHRTGDEDRDMFTGPAENATYEKLLFSSNCLTPTATVIRKKCIIDAGFFSENSDFITAEDYHLWLKLARNNIHMHFIKKILGDYRVYSGSQSSSTQKHLNAVLKVLDENFNKLNNNELFILKKRNRYSSVYYGAARSLQKSGEFRKSFKLFLVSLFFNPFILKTYIAVFLTPIMFSLKTIRFFEKHSKSVI